MSESNQLPTEPTPAEDPRPWHGAVNPFEALYQHFMGEIETLKAKIWPTAPEAPTATAAPAAQVEPPASPVEVAIDPATVA